MKVYISGISGTGMGPLALMARDAGIEVVGSDLVKGAIYEELIRAGVKVRIGAQDGEFLRENLEGVDWFVYTSALPEGHQELVMAREAGVKCTKRDDFTAFLVERLGLKMVAVAGTHGKTTTTAMIVWTALKLEMPISYIVGTTLGFAPAGAYHKGDKFFVYEADEYDRNFLKFQPWLAVIPYVSYDHKDIYPTREDYTAAFLQFEGQSENVVKMERGKIWGEPDEIMEEVRATKIGLAGEARRADAKMALFAVSRMWEEWRGEVVGQEKIREFVKVINEFPGVGRRFEQILDGLYTDYAHHPEEIKATLLMAREQGEIEGKRGVVAIYEPHQNVRQHEVREGYAEAFLEADKVFWLPTFLTREEPGLRVLTAEELIDVLVNKQNAEVAEIGDALKWKIREYLDEGYLVVLMSAGPADEWLRNEFKNANY